MARLDVAQNVQAAAVRHMDVQQDQIPLLLPQQIERLIAARGLTDRVDGGVRLEKLLESGPYDRVIVGDQNS
jgi:hypothetical protein